MKQLFIEAKYKGKITINKKEIDKLPDKIALFTTVQFIDQLKVYESEYQRGNVGRKLANYLKDYKAIMKVLLKELSDQTKFAMLPHVHKKSNYKIVITQLNTRLNKLI